MMELFMKPYLMNKNYEFLKTIFSNYAFFEKYIYLFTIFFFFFFKNLLPCLIFEKKNTKKKMRENIIAMFGSPKILRKKNMKKNDCFIFGFTIIFFKIKYN